MFFTPPSGSNYFLNATELHVLEESTNQNLCVRYSFKDKLPMKSPTKEKVCDGTCCCFRLKKTGSDAPAIVVMIFSQ